MCGKCGDRRQRNVGEVTTNVSEVTTNVSEVTTNVTNVTTHRYPKASAQAVRCRCPHMSPLRLSLLR